MVTGRFGPAQGILTGVVSSVVLMIDDQSKISFDSTNRLCLVIINYNRKGKLLF